MKSAADMDNLRKWIRKQILKGVSTIDIIETLVSEHNYAKHSAESLICGVRKELKDYYKKNKETFQVEFFEKYNDLYMCAYKQGNYLGAKQILDSQVKLCGAAEPEQKTIQFDKDKPIRVSFGFTEDEEDTYTDEDNI